MNKEELLEYARKHYPIGTQYVPVHVGIGINEVVDIDYNYDGGSTEYIHVKSKHIENSFSGCIYRDGEWAKIISKPEEKSQFEVGKWYKSNTNVYGKFLRIGNALNWYFITSERITNCGYSKDEYGFNNDKKWKLLTDLSEIQDYLPEEHPDKIVKPKSLVGRYLKSLVDKPQCIDCASKNEYFLIKYENSATLDIIRIIDNSNCWSASKDEIGKTWELMPEGFDPKNEIAKQKIPEYLECIPSKLSQSYAIVGRIYKFVKTLEEHWGVECNLDCAGYNAGTILYFCPEQFKPSTKEAYDRQQNIEKQWIPKVGDWVVSLVDREGYRKKGDVFQVLEISGDCIYYAQNTNGYINTFRPAEAHEIPKENLKPSVSISAYMVDGVCTISPLETKPKITESYKWVEMDFNKLVNTGAIQYKEEEIKIQIKKSKTIKI